LHDLHALEKVSIRSNTWICHPRNQFMSLSHYVGLSESILGPDQCFVRKRIARRMLAFDDRFQMFVLEMAKTLPLSGYGGEIVSNRGLQAHCAFREIAKHYKTVRLNRSDIIVHTV
jgi:hypothetical protein